MNWKIEQTSSGAWPLVLKIKEQSESQLKEQNNG
jgi:hypothetical protein